MQVEGTAKGHVFGVHAPTAAVPVSGKKERRERLESWSVQAASGSVGQGKAR
jgi:hypothetical protein